MKLSTILFSLPFHTKVREKQGALATLLLIAIFFVSPNVVLAATQQTNPDLDTSVGLTDVDEQNDVKKDLPENINQSNDNRNIVNPEKADAQVGVITTLITLNNLYQPVMTAKDYLAGAVDLEIYINQLFTTLMVNPALTLIYGCPKFSVAGDMKKAEMEGEKIVNPETGETLDPEGNCEAALPIEILAARIESGQSNLGNLGVAGYTSLAANSIVNEPPIPGDLAYFSNDIIKSSMFSNNAFAQNLTLTRTDPFFQVVVYGFWKGTRNIAMSLVALFLGIGALGVMFRQKLGGQAIVTIYTVLPYVPVVIILVLLSYPIMVILMNLGVGFWSLGREFAFSIGRDVGLGLQDDVAETRNFAAQGAYILFGMWDFLFRILPGTFAMLVAVIWIISATLLMIFVFVFQWIKTYMNFIYYTIFAPLVLLSAMLPGRQYIIMYFLKVVFVEVLILPYMVFVFQTALGILGALVLGGATIPSIGAPVGIFSSALNVLGVLVLLTICWSLIWSIPKARKTMASFLGVAGGSIWGPPQQGSVKNVTSKNVIPSSTYV